jgi:hypothetical protein
MMTSPKQERANRRNSQKSTGPKTQEGKAAVHLNAVKHGLLSQEVLLPDEDGAAIEELGERVRAELQPVGELEGLLADRIVAAYWRLRRLGRVEAGIFAWEHYEELIERAQGEAQTYERNRLDDLLDPRSASYNRITDDQGHQEALSQAQEMKAKQDTDTAMLGRTFIRDADKANAFSKLSRYETAIERSLYKALHELQRLQAAREAGSRVPPPPAIDVDVSGISREGS